MERSNQIILVTGATGHQGGAVARHLLQRNQFTVHALVRNKNKPEAVALEQAGAKLIQGNLDDRPSLDKALKGVWGVFSVQASNNGADIEMRQGNTLADAAAVAGVKHFVYSSVGSADRKTGIPHFESKFKIEEHIKAMSLPYTILRPVFFLYNYNAMRPVIEKGTLAMALSPGTKLMQLSEDDYGEIVATVFERPDAYLKQARDVASVNMSMSEVADTFAKVLGTPVAYQQISFDEIAKQIGKERTLMFRWFEEKGYNADLPSLEKEFGKPTGLESYLRTHGWARGTGGAAK